MSSLSKKYLSIISKILDKISDEEEKKITDCARIIADSYKKGGQLYIFGTGHSRLLGEEAFHRAGGFAAACPIRDDNLTFKKGATTATSLERTPNIARKSLQKYKISNPDFASKLGIGMVHQEFRLVESFSIKDNLTLSRSNIYIDNFKTAYKKYSEIFALNVREDEAVSNLSVGEKQKIEIMKLIFNNSNIMLLDEPTAVLTPQETLQLKDSLLTLAKEDMKTIVLITHKLKEIREFTEIVSVLRNGKMVSNDLLTQEVSNNELINLMMGEVQKSQINKNKPRKTPNKKLN